MLKRGWTYASWEMNYLEDHWYEIGKTFLLLVVHKLIISTQSFPNPPEKKWVSGSRSENPATANKKYIPWRITWHAYMPMLLVLRMGAKQTEKNIWRPQHLRFCEKKMVVQAAKSRDVGTLKRDTRQMSKPRLCAVSIGRRNTRIEFFVIFSNFVISSVFIFTWVWKQGYLCASMPYLSHLSPHIYIYIGTPFFVQAVLLKDQLQTWSCNRTSPWHFGLAEYTRVIGTRK